MPKYIRMPERIRVFENVVPNEAHARKVLEEAGEVLEAWGVWDELKDWSDFYDDFKRKELVDECADVIQATTNLLFALGVKDATEALKRCESRNEKRGRYSDCDGENGDSPVFDEDAEALAWVRNHGGLATVEAVWKNELPLALALPSELWPDGMPDDCTTEFIIGELHKRLMPAGYEWDHRFARAIEFFETMHELLYTVDCEEDYDGPEMVREVMRRLMPRGYEWPRFEDGEQVRIGDKATRYEDDFEVRYIGTYGDGSFLLNFWSYANGERVKRPAPMVLGVDGAEIREGEEVYDAKTGERFVVEAVYGGTTEPDFPEHTIRCHKSGDIVAHMFAPDQLTHTKPEIDSWERIEEDLPKSYTEYWGCVGVPCFKCPAVIEGKKPHERFDGNCIIAMRRDIVRRCKALSERGQ